jgi:hypothetical protein
MTPRGLSVKAAAAYIGVSVRDLLAARRAGELAAVRWPGCRRVVFDGQDLDALFVECVQGSAVTNAVTTPHPARSSSGALVSAGMPGESSRRVAALTPEGIATRVREYATLADVGSHAIPPPAATGAPAHPTVPPELPAQEARGDLLRPCPDFPPIPKRPRASHEPR